MSRRLLAAFVAAAALSASACSSGGGEPDLADSGSDVPVELATAPGFDGEAIHVGVLVPASGPLKEIAAERATGLRAYLDYITLGLGGVGGKYPVVLEVRDSSDTASVAATYEELRSSTALMAQVQGRAAVEALLPGLTAAGGLAGPMPADLAWSRDAGLLPVGTPDQLAAANALSWLVSEGDLAGGAKVCSAVQDGADGQSWQQGLELAASAGRLDRPLAATVAIPAETTSARGVLDQFDTLVATGCEVVFLVAGSPATADVLTAASGADSPIRWVIPSWSTSMALQSEPLEPYLADHLVVVGDGPTTPEPVGLPELVRIRDGYAPGLEVGGAFTAGYLQGRAIVTVLEAAVSRGDLSAEGIRAVAARLRSVPFDELAADAAYGTPASRRVPMSSTISVPDPDTSTRLRPVAFDVSAPFAAALVTELVQPD